MGHLAPFKAEGCLDFVAFLKETYGLVFLGLIIVLVDGDRELDFFYYDDFLLLAGSAVTLVFLVEKFSVVLDTADGRHSVGRDFDQVQPAFAGNFQCFKWLQNAQLVAFVVNDADFTGTNFIVNTDK